MWIAKPLSNLSESEKALWQEIEQDLPLAQTLNWAYATEAVGSKAYLVFSPEEKAGGIVFSTASRKTPNGLKFECVNGPALKWDDPKTAPRQIATFAMAVSKLDPRFESLSLKPRWEAGQMNRRVSLLPLPLFNHSEAATLLVPVISDEKSQLESFNPRLRRTLSTTWRNEITTRWEKVTPTLLSSFVPAMKAFANDRDFSVPPLAWFEALTRTQGRLSPSFWLASCEKWDEAHCVSRSQILICMRKSRAHYLFGYETRSKEKLRSAVSTSAAAHWEALRKCASAQIQDYDLNGYVVDSEPSHPYTGVCQFKEQFAGKLIEYQVPEFVIE